MQARGRPDLVLLVAVMALLLVGLEMVFSASFVVAYSEFGDDKYFFVRQLIWAGLGILLMMLAAKSDYHRWLSFSTLFMVLSLAGLLAVLLPGIGTTTYGASRWLTPLPGVNLQPSEFAKLAMVLYMSDWLAKKGIKVGSLTYGSIPFIVVVGLIAGLVLMEPDLGSTFVIVATSLAIFFVAGANLLHLVPVLLIGVLAMFRAVQAEGYRVSRLTAFLDPWSDPQGIGWHTVQTLIALGSGGITGMGLGASRQKAFAVPNAHTDAIFAIIGEELGLIGTLAVLALFGILGWRGLRVAFSAPDSAGRLLAAGLTSMLLIQAGTNIAVVTRTLPYTGIPLPFISFGGSSLTVSLLAVGLLLSVSRHGEWKAEEGKRKKDRVVAGISN